MSDVREGSMVMVITRCGCGLTTYEPNHKCPSPKSVEVRTADQVVVEEVE